MLWLWIALALPLLVRADEPVRVPVYVGGSLALQEMLYGDPAQWEFVRTHADGWYCNNFHLYHMSDEEIALMRQRFRSNKVFYETDFWYASAADDRYHLDRLRKAGFDVVIQTYNRPHWEERIDNLRFRDPSTPILRMVAPWFCGGDFADGDKGAHTNFEEPPPPDSDRLWKYDVRNSGRQNDVLSPSVEGISTDGPMHYWENNTGAIRTGSTTMFQWTRDQGKISMGMLAPCELDGDEFLDWSKFYINFHEQEDAVADIWVMQHYGPPSYPAVSLPEKNPDGSPAETFLGGAYWLIQKYKGDAPVIPSPPHPNAPFAPHPASGSTNLALNTQLHFSPGRDATSHTIYFGTSPDQLDAVVVDGPGCFYDPGLLDPDTTYFWRADAINETGIEPGPLWSFTTTSALDAPIDFRTMPIYAFGARSPPYSSRDNQGNGTVSVAEDGASIALDGARWVSVDYQYTITPDTVLEFEFESTEQGQTHAIALTPTLHENPDQTFMLFGTNTYGLTSYNTYQIADGRRLFRIPVGLYMTGEVNHLAFINRNPVEWWETPASANSVFANVRLLEDPSVDLPNGIWTGSAGTRQLSDGGNWTGDAAPASGDAALWAGRDAGPLDLVLNGFVGGDSTGIRLQLNSPQTDPLVIDSTVGGLLRLAPRVGNGITRDAASIGIHAQAGPLRIGAISGTENPLELRLGGTANELRHEFHNASPNPATIGSNVTITRSGTSNNHIYFRGPGSWQLLGTIATQGTGEFGLLGSTTLTAVLTLAGDNSALTPGNFFVCGGTMEFSELKNLPGGNGPIRFGHGTGAGTLRYTGSDAVQINRSIQLSHSTAAPEYAGTIDASGAGTLSFTPATFNNPYTVARRSHTLTLTGDNISTNTLHGTIQNNHNSETGRVAIAKSGPGTWVLAGSNTYSGATEVHEGTLIINGDQSGATNTVTVASGAAIGGGGTLGGNLHLDAGAKLVFDPAKTLGVGGTVIFGGFGIADLQGLDSSVATGTYTILSGTVNTANLSNLGEEAKVSLGDNKVAWFETGSLQLVVAEESVEPEPFDITDVAMSLDNGNAVVEVVFDSTGHSYTLQRTTNLVSGVWQDVAWGESPLRYTNDTAQGFFRIKAE